MNISPTIGGWFILGNPENPSKPIREDKNQQDLLEKLEATNDNLLESLKRITDQYKKSKNLFTMDRLVIKQAELAIEKYNK